MRRFFLLLIFAVFVSFITRANKATDSLSLLIQKEKNNPARLSLLFGLCDMYRTYTADSLYSYSQRTIDAAEQSKSKFLLAKSYLYLGIYYYKTSRLDSVKQIIAYIKKQISSPRSFAEKQLVNKANILLGGVNIKENKQKEAMSLYYDVLAKAID